LTYFRKKHREPIAKLKNNGVGITAPLPNNISDEIVSYCSNINFKDSTELDIDLIIGYLDVLTLIEDLDT